jgi:hypothetical protein
MAAAFRGFQQHFNELLPVGAAADHIHTQPADSVCVMLAVAAADGDDRVGVAFPAAADDGPVLFVRHSGNGAGIDDVAVAILFEMANFVTLLDQEPLHSLGFILICLTAEGIKSYFHIVISTNKSSFILF